ncbi:hypothetical protein BKA56DRAFT_692543 [Ilyonectria sp. MPI-CAGE-AT-0026]|nr:hypothetical protein BKA56DRAFT_692543 [Ilyonectria sp. MPI-CAGE-AT-0026]
MDNPNHEGTSPSRFYPHKRPRLASPTGSTSGSQPIAMEEPVPKPEEVEGAGGLNARCHYPEAEAVATLLHPHVIEKIMGANEERKQVALRLGLTLNDIGFSGTDLLIRWEGLPSDLDRPADGIFTRSPAPDGLTGPGSTPDPTILWASKTLKRDVKTWLTCNGPQPILYDKIRTLLGQDVQLKILHESMQDLKTGVLEPIDQVVQFSNGLKFKEEASGPEMQVANDEVFPLAFFRAFGVLEFNEELPLDAFERWQAFTKGWWTGSEIRIRTRVNMILLAWKDPGGLETVEDFLLSLLKMEQVARMLRGGREAWNLVDAEMTKVLPPAVPMKGPQ